MFIASVIIYTYLLNIIMIKQENNDIESKTPNIPRLYGNSPNLPIKPVVMNIKYVLRKGLEFYIFMIVKPLDILNWPV
jgi:hypothetical protein